MKYEKKWFPNVRLDDCGIWKLSDEGVCTYKKDIKHCRTLLLFTTEIVNYEERKYLSTLPAHINFRISVEHFTDVRKPQKNQGITL